MDRVDLVTTGVAVGGAALARDGDGRVVFVEGALPGERVSAEIVATKRSYRSARVIEVLDSSPGRIEPVCPEVARGCGGCDLAYASGDEQRNVNASIVGDALRRIGRIEAPPPIDPGPDLATTGFRTTVRAGVRGGRAGLRRRHSHDLVEVASCRVAHPLVDDLLTGGRYPGSAEVTIRVGATTGDRAVVVDGSPADVDVPGDVTVTTRDGEVAIVDEVGGHPFRISPRSFFQTRNDGAQALVDVVGDAMRRSPHGTMVDLCCGVGLFAATVGETFDRVVAVESNRSAIADARVNLAHLGPRAVVTHSAFERWVPEEADVVVADPSRVGLGRDGVDRVVGTGASTVVLVSCDAGSLGRDARLFVDSGYSLEALTLVDLFPDTAHVEVVSVFCRVESGDT